MMIRQLIRTNKRLLIFFVFGTMTAMYSSAQRDVKNLRNVADKDTLLRLTSPYYGGAWQITDAIYKAIDPRLIANKHGVLTEEKNGGVGKSFSLFIYDGAFPVRNAGSSPIFGGHNKWNYYINDENMFGAGRALISAIMPQAIESIDFTPPGPKDMPKTKIILPKSFREDSINKGIIRFQTRDISKSAINDSATVYLLNDNKVITRKIYDALNPVFIRSLKRITNPEELADYGYKGKTEIVKIELFESEDLAEEKFLWFDECPKCEVILVDNIEIDWKIYEAISQFHIKEIRKITEDDKKAFAPYSKLFTKEKIGWKKQITIITL